MPSLVGLPHNISYHTPCVLSIYSYRFRHLHCLLFIHTFRMLCLAQSCSALSSLAAGLGGGEFTGQISGSGPLGLAGSGICTNVSFQLSGCAGSGSGSIRWTGIVRGPISFNSSALSLLRLPACTGGGPLPSEATTIVIAVTDATPIASADHS
jgi:hypothetical protein